MSSQHDDESEEYNYIFGFGSIMNTSTHATWQTDKKNDASSSNDNDNNNNNMQGAVVTIHKSFGYKRKWNFRSATGFTALGVVKVAPSSSSSSPASPEVDNEPSDINGVIFRVSKEEMPNFDRREVGYTRLQVPLEFVTFHPNFTGTTPQTNFHLKPNVDVIWLYVPLPSQTMYADENHPLLQSYVDTVLQGCLEWGSEAMAEQFIFTTGGWSRYYLNDTPSSRRPWLFRKQYATIDTLLSKHSTLTNYGDRRHPEEFAMLKSSSNNALLRQHDNNNRGDQQHRMKGTWSIPRRNPNFTGREVELKELSSRFSSQGSGSGGGGQMVVKVEVAGMGGVGKSCLVTEYCYRHYPTEYGLIIWLNAETVDTLITDYRQLLADLANVDADMDKSTDELVGEVKTRLFRSNVPWLLVFDNIENSDWKKFVPNGAGMRGHVLVTTRHMEVESGTSDSDGTLSLGCFHTSEAIELLRRSAGSHNMEGPSNAASARELSERLGNLPLALSMAAAYMRQCDVQCSEYLDRYAASEKHGQSLLHRGKLQDYSLTVASSLSLILPKIEEENRTASEVLHLLSYMGPDMITKPLLRHLLNAKANVDRCIEEEECEDASKYQFSRKNVSFMLCGTILGGAALALPAVHTRRAWHVAMLTMTATSILFLSKSRAKNDKLGEKSESTRRRMKKSISVSGSFSAFEYEQSDLSWDILKSFSLLSVKEGKGSVHRLLQQAMRSRPSEEGTLYYLKICVDALTSTWTFKPEEIKSWKESLQLLEHVKSVVAHSQNCHFDAQYTLNISQLSKEAGVLSAMALNAFVEAHASLEISLKLLDSRTNLANKPEFRKARAEALYELSKVHRYQGQYDDANRCLTDSLALNNADDCLTADALHELGILEVKRHNLDSAASFLQRSLQIRNSLEDDTNIDHRTNTDSAASSTLHQLAAIHVARKPPSLEKAKTLLQEALSLSRQIGQRAATLKQLARVTIRQGFLDQAESYLGQALELYLELYGDNKLHINVAAVKFQQGALAVQREQLDDAWRSFYECLRIRRHVYAYAASSEDTNPIHLEVSCVLHELASVGFAQKRFSQSMEMLKAERTILETLEERSHNERIYQARFTNLTWSIKCAKEMGDDKVATQFSNERMALKKSTGQKSREKPHHLHSDSVTLQQKAMECRLLARKFALEKNDSKIKLTEKLYNHEKLLARLEELGEEIKTASPGPMKQAATQFRDSLLLWVDQPGMRSPVLTACDRLRDVLRAYGVQVNDSITSRK